MPWRCDKSWGATENAGQENDGQKCNTQNALNSAVRYYYK